MIIAAAMSILIKTIVISFLVSNFSDPICATPHGRYQVIEHLSGEWLAPKSFVGFMENIFKLRQPSNSPADFSQFGPKLDEFLSRVTENGDTENSFDIADLYDDLQILAHDKARSPELRQRAFWTIGALLGLPSGDILTWHSTEYQDLIIRFTSSDVPVIQSEALEMVSSLGFLKGRYSTVDFDLTETALDQLHEVWKQAKPNSQSRNAIQDAANRIRSGETTYWTSNSRGNSPFEIAGRFLFRCVSSFSSNR